MGSRRNENPDIQICAVIETRMNQIIDKLNKTDSIFEADPLDSEVRILDWILYIVRSNEINYYDINYKFNSPRPNLKTIDTRQDLDKLVGKVCGK